MKDETLVDECVSGNAKAQKLLFDRFAPKMMGVCIRYVKDQEKANDVLQDSFIKVFHSLDTFKKEGSLEGWVRRIVTNTALDHIRKNKKFLANVEIDEIHVSVVEKSKAVGRLENESLMEIINSLPDGYRIVFNMFAIEGYSHKEIADKLDITESTSKSQYARARQAIKKLMEKYNIER